MAGRNPETYQTQFQNPDKVRSDIQIDPNQKTKGERFARGYRALSVGQAVVYGGLGFIHPVFWAGSAFNVGEAVVSHKIVKNKERQRIEGQPARVGEKDMQPGKPVNARTVKELQAA